MVHITDIDKVNWLIDTDKSLKDLRSTKKLALADCEFVSPRLLVMQPNFSLPDAGLKEIQSEAFSCLREEIETAIDKARDCIFYKLKELGIVTAAGEV